MDSKEPTTAEIQKRYDRDEVLLLSVNASTEPFANHRDCGVLLKRLEASEATIKAIGDYNYSLLHEDDCDARYNDDVADDEHEECNCSKGRIQALLNRSGE